MAVGFLRGAAARAAGTTALNDPSAWGGPDGAADAVPRLFYRLVTYAAIRSAGDR